MVQPFKVITTSPTNLQFGYVNITTDTQLSTQVSFHIQGGGGGGGGSDTLISNDEWLWMVARRPSTTKRKVIIQTNIWYHWYYILATLSVMFACHPIWRGHPPSRDPWRHVKTHYMDLTGFGLLTISLVHIYILSCQTGNKPLSIKHRGQNFQIHLLKKLFFFLNCIHIFQFKFHFVQASMHLLTELSKHSSVFVWFQEHNQDNIIGKSLSYWRSKIATGDIMWYYFVVIFVICISLLTSVII